MFVIRHEDTKSQRIYELKNFVPQILSQNISCHSERIEESLFLTGQTLRFAQGDSFEIIT